MVGGYLIPLAFMRIGKTKRHAAIGGVPKRLASYYWIQPRQRPIISTVGLALLLWSSDWSHMYRIEEVPRSSLDDLGAISR
jgi:hypothetical protein